MNKGAVQQSIQRVLVLGDLAFETLLIPETSTQKHGTKKLSDYVGATIIRDIIVEALHPTQKSKGVAAKVKVYPKGRPPQDCPGHQLRELVAVFGKFPKSHKATDLTLFGGWEPPIARAWTQGRLTTMVRILKRTLKRVPPLTLS